MSPLTVVFVGDAHGHLRYMYERLLELQKKQGLQIDYVFQVGDFGIWIDEGSLDRSCIRYAERRKIPLSEMVGDFPSLVLGEWEIPVPTYFIRGNHEDQALLLTHERTLAERYPNDYLRRPARILHNLFYVPDSHIVKLGKTRIAGWGGCWGQKTWGLDYWGEVRAARDQNGHARRLNHMTRDRFERLVREDFDILVTHDAPTGMGVRGSRNRKEVDPEIMTESHPEGTGVSYIRELLEERKPRFHFCGHWHQYKGCHIGDTASVVLDRVDPKFPEAQCFQVINIP